MWLSWLRIDGIGRLRQHADGDLVGHRARGHPQRRLLAQQRRHAFLQQVDGRIFAELVVADRRGGHRRAHGGGRPRDGVGSQIDDGGARLRWGSWHGAVDGSIGRERTRLALRASAGKPTMRTLLLALLLAGAAAPAWSQTSDELVNDGKNPANVTTQSMGYDRKSYSPLRQINKSNVKRLVPIWSTSLMNDMGELAAPTIYNGVMYVINGKWSFAIDVETGRQIWRTPVQYEPGSQPTAAITRGAATIYNGKLFRVTYDNHVLALDMKTGKELWNQKFADAKEGYYSTSAPIVANGVLLSGMAGGEFTTRGFIDGWDPDTGKKLWRRHTIPAPGEPGSETWPKDSDAWKYGGGPTWRSGSYDPALDLVYWGTGNAEPYDPRPRGGLDSLYTSSVLAIRPKTGEIACHYQYTPNDVYDVDGADEHVLADIPVNGQVRKVMIQPNKNGFLYVLDRTNCRLIAAHPFVKVNWATHVDLATGRPVLTDLYKRFLAGEEVEIWPSRSTNAVPIAFNPATEPRLRHHVEHRAYPEACASAARSRSASDPPGPPHASRRRSRATRWATSWRSIRSRARRSGRSRSTCRVRPACSRRAAGCSSPASRPASSWCSTRPPARRCGSSRPDRA